MEGKEKETIEEGMCRLKGITEEMKQT